MSNLPPLAGIPLSEMNEMRRDLVRAMSGGQLSVRYADGTSITYRTMPEMKAALDELEGRIVTATALPGDTSSVGIRAFRITPFSGWR